MEEVRVLLEEAGLGFAGAEEVDAVQAPWLVDKEEGLRGWGW